MSGFRGNALMAIDLLKAKGELNGTDAIVWEYNKNASYTPSALLADGKLYFLRSNNGNLTCLDAVDGKENYSLEKLDGTGIIFASPVGADGRIYITSQSGISYVLKEGPTFEILAKNELEDGNFSSPAIVVDDLFIRGFKYLYCISAE
jgi:outer membrane protein assembly factor BamB